MNVKVGSEIIGPKQHFFNYFSGVKPYVCPHCLRGCVSSTQLKRHMRIHTGEKPFGCELCSKTFRRREDLKNHTKIHNGKFSFSFAVIFLLFIAYLDERNHVCPVCNKGFFQRNTLKVHLRIHTGKSCLICSSLDKILCFQVKNLILAISAMHLFHNLDHTPLIWKPTMMRTTALFRLKSKKSCVIHNYVIFCVLTVFLRTCCGLIATNCTKFALLNKKNTIALLFNFY